MNYRAEIDGLRAVAVVPVVIYHAGFGILSGGFLGVDVFFVISGYLITSIIINEVHRGQFSILNFYERRVRRIIPLLYTVVLISIAISWFALLPSHMNDFSESIISVLLFISNIFFWTEGGYFSVAAELKPLLHTWTLSVEEQFYLLFPLFFVVVWRLGLNWLFLSLVLIAIFSLLIAQWGSVTHPEAAFYLLPTRGWELMSGSLVALAEFRKKAFNPSQLLSLCGLLMVLGSFIFFDNNTQHPSFYTIVPVCGAVLILIYGSKGTISHRLLSKRILVGIGLISYGVYLWHQPIFVFVRHFTDMNLRADLALFLIAIVFIVSYFSWRFIEQPFRKAQVVSGRLLISFFVGFSMILFAFGIAGIKTSGFLNRYDEADQKILLSSINATNYMLNYFNSILLQDFDPENPAPRVLVIGDSFAQDLVNAVNESPLSERFQISTYRISGRCGNLYLEQDFTHNIAPHDLDTCLSAAWYQNSELQELLYQADEAWLASSWQAWNAELLPISVERIASEFGVKVTVFGTKEFSNVNIRELLQLPESERFQHSTEVPERVRVVNDVIASGLDNTRFINISELLCPNFLCPTLTSDGYTLTFDGSHLTRSGAEKLGGLLAEEYTND